MESVAGLKDYASVTFAGKEVGVVEKIELQEMDGRPWAVLTCSLHEPAYIVLDSTARIAQSSLLGELYLELSQGTSKIHIADATTKPWVLEGTSVITFDQVFTAVDRISSQIEDILRDVKRISGDQDIHSSVKTTFSRLEEAADHIQRTADTVHGVIAATTPDIQYMLSKGREVADSLQAASSKVREGADQVPDLVTDLRQHAQSLSEHVESLVTQAKGVIKDSQPKLDKTLENLSALTEQVRLDAERLAKDLRDLAANVNGLVVENRGEVSRILDDLAVTASHLSSISRQLDEHPWRVIWRTEGRVPPPSETPDWNPHLPKPGQH
jgi:ABC-type transporter Mla subunit MlaD